MSMRQYAKHRGVSPEAVSKAVEKGRISCKRDKKGQAQIDPEVADREWQSNSDPAKVLAAGQMQQVAQPQKETPQGPSIVQSTALLRAFQAKLAKLEFDEKDGTLVNAEDVDRKWTAIAAIVRTKVLGIPSKVRQRLPEITPEQYAMLEAIVRESLEDLSDGEN